MNDINNGYDRWLTTLPDDNDPEQEYCEYCGQPMELCTKGYTHLTCVNQFCPEKWTNEIVHNMANHLVEVEQELADAKDSLRYANARITNLTTIRIRREDRIQELEEEIEKLTQSQQGE